MLYSNGALKFCSTETEILAPSVLNQMSLNNDNNSIDNYLSVVVW